MKKKQSSKSKRKVVKSHETESISNEEKMVRMVKSSEVECMSSVGTGKSREVVVMESEGVVGEKIEEIVVVES